MAWNIRVTDSMVQDLEMAPLHRFGHLDLGRKDGQHDVGGRRPPSVHGSVGIVRADGHLAVVHGHQHGLVVEDDSGAMTLHDLA